MISTGARGGRAGLGAYLRSEAASTQLLGSYGFPWVCLYDRRRYSPEALAEVARVHPEVLGADGIAARNAEYVEPAAYLCAHPGPVSPSRPTLPWR